MKFRYCYDCIETEDGLCNECVEYYNVCLNCVAYGDGSVCENCEKDESICLDYDIAEILEFIERNYTYFQT
jgi:hypothetical protein